jgi:hypothetical protein
MTPVVSANFGVLTLHPENRMDIWRPNRARHDLVRV